MAMPVPEMARRGRYGERMRLGPLALRRALKGTLRRGPLQRGALAVAARRGHGLTLLFHRVAPEGPRDHEVVRSVPLELFRAQLDVLTSLGEVVAAEELAAEPAAGRRPRFALTFDDDYASQLLAAEVLAERGLPGTFFLSGRALHGLGAYWWEVLEARIAAEGLPVVAASLGVAAATPQELAARCEATPLATALAREGDPTPAAHLDAEDLTRLAALPGVTVGFHTVHHHVLPSLDASALDEALTLGRDEMSEAVGRVVDLIAYPHGKATDPVAAATAAAGFRLAWTGRIEPTTSAADPHLLGRWEPHELEPDDFAAQLTVRLNLPDRGP
jgi:peptidoglycan/xylan/chitin deacetylase (PgdA/CDA1 family)